MKLRYLGVLALAALAACDSPLDVTPQQSIDREDALDSPEEIRVAVNGMYDALQTCDGGYCRNLLVYPDLYTDNLRFTGTYTTDREVGNREVRTDNAAVSGIWGSAYVGISRANNVLAAIGEVEGFDEGEEGYLEGQAHFVRALNYLNLVNFFGGVPLVLEPTWEITPDVNVSRASEAEVWAQIESDLETAMDQLPSVLDIGTQYVASYEAAEALLARAHLYQREWQQAYDLADDVIENGPFGLQPTYASVFSSEENAEILFAISFTTLDSNALAFWFYPAALGGRRGFGPTATAAGLPAAFGAGDTRRVLATNSASNTSTTAYGQKYTDVSTGSDDVPVIRLAELYLIRSEAAARLGGAGNLAQAIADINTVRRRAYNGSATGNLPATVDTQDEILQANLNERRLELFYEGHRFFDLKRFSDRPFAASILTSLGLTGYHLLFPIPQDEIEANPALEQNPGY